MNNLESSYPKIKDRAAGKIDDPSREKSPKAIPFQGKPRVVGASSIPVRRVSSPPRVKQLLPEVQIKPSNSFWNFIKVIVIVSSFIALVLIVFFSTPLSFREDLVKSKNFESLPFQKELCSFLLRDSSQTFLTTLKKNISCKFAVDIKQQTRITGTLRLNQRPTTPLPIIFKINKVGTKEPVFQKLLEIDSASESLELATELVPTGVYTFELLCKPWPDHIEIPAQVTTLSRH
jgi:hypothetical protein